MKLLLSRLIPILGTASVIIGLILTAGISNNEVFAVAPATQMAKDVKADSLRQHPMMENIVTRMGRGDSAHASMAATESPMMQMMMAHMILPSSVTPLPDGSIVVAAGTMLKKYDKDLNLVKEVEVSVDIDKMAESMKKMMEMCPVCMREKGMMPNNRSTEMKSAAPPMERK